jgi:hypothetical protein
MPNRTFQDPFKCGPPRFKHDCDKCIYLGQVDDCDAYLCVDTENGGMSDIIWRHSDEPSDNGSNIVSTCLQNMAYGVDPEYHDHYPYVIMRSLLQLRAINFVGVSFVEREIQYLKGEL